MTKPHWAWRVVFVLAAIVWFLWVWEFYWQATKHRSPQYWINQHIQPEQG